LLLGLTPIVWVAWVIRTISGKSHQNMTHGATVGVKRSAPNLTEAERNTPAEGFSDVGGADDAKDKYARSYRDTCIPRDTSVMAYFGTASCYMARVAGTIPRTLIQSAQRRSLL
jgi:hypothetical protein